MTPAADEPKWRKLVSEICLSLPEATSEAQGDHTTFKVRSKVFAYLLHNHHQDGIVSVCVKSELGENEERARTQPETYYLPAYIGKRGWFGLYLNKGPVNRNEVIQIIKRSYCLVAPKSLVAQV